MNRLLDAEDAIVATLAKMGPLAFVPLAQLLREHRRQLVGFGLNRLQAQGKVVIHGHRAVSENEDGVKLIPIYCARRTAEDVAAADVNRGQDNCDGPGQGSTGSAATCPACGWSRIGP